MAEKRHAKATASNDIASTVENAQCGIVSALSHALHSCSYNLLVFFLADVGPLLNPPETSDNLAAIQSNEAPLSVPPKPDQFMVVE